MTKQLDLNDYKQGIADLYNRRSQTLEQAKATWEGISRPPLAKYRNLSSKLSSERLVKAKAEFEAKLEALQTEQGVKICYNRLGFKILKLKLNSWVNISASMMRKSGGAVAGFTPRIHCWNYQQRKSKKFRLNMQKKLKF